MLLIMNQYDIEDHCLLIFCECLLSTLAYRNF